MIRHEIKAFTTTKLTAKAIQKRTNYYRYEKETRLTGNMPRLDNEKRRSNIGLVGYGMKLKVKTAYTTVLGKLKKIH